MLVRPPRPLRWLVYGLALLAFALATAGHGQDRRPPEETSPRSRVFGRVVNAEGKPIEGVAVELHSVGGPWCAEDKRNEFQAATRGDGTFLFEVPTPTCDWATLLVRPDAYHDIASRDFGPAGGRDEPRLVRGDNDLGEFRLADTGSIAGRVVGPTGEPVVGAEVRLAVRIPGGMGRCGKSDASGAFEIGHVPPDSYTLEVLANGYFLARDVRLGVKTRETTRANDIALASGPTISGVVVDEEGAPIANARVLGSPWRGGAGSRARTDADGRFVLTLRHDAPHSFEVEAEGYSKLLEQSWLCPIRLHSSGATDVRLVLERPVLTTFVVLDARTAQPVTRYAVRLDWKPSDHGSPSGREPVYPLAEHPGGEFACQADEEMFVYCITSPGYAPATGPILIDSTATRRCVVAMAPESSLRGRVVLGGQPVARAELRLYAGSLRRFDEEDQGVEHAYDEEGYFWSDWDGKTDLCFVLPQRTKHWCDADGRFSLPGLATGEYRLEFQGPKGARLSLDPLAVFEGEQVDLHDVSLIAGASLAGEVLLPSGIDPESVELHCYSWDQTIHAKVRADRTFLFEGVPAGRARVGVDKAPGLVTWGEHPMVELAPGSTGRLTLDLSSRTSVPVTVKVLVNGRPAQGVRVRLSNAQQSIGDYGGETDAAGVASRSVLAVGLASVTLEASSGVRLGTFERALDVAVGTKPEATIDVPCGSIEVEWPALRKDEPLYLVQLGCFLDDDAKRMWPHAMPGWDGPENDARITGERRARFAWIPPGETEWTIEVQTLEGNEVRRYHTFRRKLTVRAGETTECLLDERDRVKGP